MNILYKKSFGGDLEKISNAATKAKVGQIILLVGKVVSQSNIPGLKKMKTGKKGNYYRIRMGDYRIGVEIEGDTVTFVAFGHRKDIYKSFP